MDLNYVAGATALSWDAQCKFITERSVIETKIFKLDAETNKGINKFNLESAKNAQQNMREQGVQSCTSGIAQMVGAGLDVGATIGTNAMSSRRAGEASNLEEQLKGENQTTTNLTLQTETHETPQPPTQATDTNATDIQAEQPGAGIVEATPNRTNEEALDTANKDLENKIAQKKNDAQFWENAGKNFGQVFSAVTTGVGSIINQQHLNSQGSAQLMQKIADGTSEILKTIESSYKTILGNADSMIQNANSTIAAIIGAGRV